MTRPAASKAPAPLATTVEAIWGTVLPIPAGPGAGDDFTARVQRVWEHMKAGYFAAAEYGRLREVLGALIAKEVTAAGSHQESRP